MARVIPGRFTASVGGPFVVFIIGMRINNIFAIRKWLPTAFAMSPPLKALFSHSEKGVLGGETFVNWRGTGLVTYWRSFEDLERFARNPDDPHLEPRRQFNKNIGTDGSAGIWHETYMVQAGQHECIYNNMPDFGLAKATQHVPAVGKRETARRRLGGEDQPAVPSPPAVHSHNNKE